MSSGQASLDTFTAGVDEIEVTRTVRLKLETSDRKNERVRKAIEEWHEIAQTVAEHHPSFPEYEWGRTKQNPSFYRIVQREHPDSDIHSESSISAVHKVGGAFKTWSSKGKEGKRPQFGDGDYVRFTSGGIDVVENERGWGLKVKLEPYDAEWFHIVDGGFQREFLQRVTDDDDPCSHGSAELHLHDGGGLYCHLSVSWPVDVFQPDDVQTTVGVDLNDDPLTVAAVVEGGSVEAVQFESGSEYRHNRERVKQKRRQAMESGDLESIKQSRLMYNKYTDHITNVVSRRVIDLAREHTPTKIHLEDLTDYQATADAPIHDWPYAEIQQKIAYKAREEGIPVQAIDPAGTSITCRKCGECNPEMRDGRDFTCWGCGYEVHADVNAAINIAQA